MMVPDFRRDDVWIPVVATRNRAFSGMTNSSLAMGNKTPKDLIIQCEIEYGQTPLRERSAHAHLKKNIWVVQKRPLKYLDALIPF